MNYEYPPDPSWDDFVKKALAILGGFVIFALIILSC